MYTIPHLNPPKVVFLTGAGISLNAPTNAPNGNELTLRVFENAFLPEAIMKIKKLYCDFEISNRTLPRLEVILDIATQVNSIDILSTFLSDLERGIPNDFHKFFSRHLKLGGKHITANFDTFIENGEKFSEIIHFHGFIEPGVNNYSKLGARLTSIERGFNQTTQENLLQSLLFDENLTLIVVGYSGLDYFDMDTFFRKYANQICGKICRVIWIQHNENSTIMFNKKKDYSIYPPILKCLYDTGTECEFIECITVDFLNQLAIQWKLPPLPNRKKTHENWSRMSLICDEKKIKATARLYQHMGMYNDYLNLIEKYPNIKNLADFAILAEICWQKGKYREAFTYWKKVFNGDDNRSVARLKERSAACYWIRGSYLKAYLKALQARSSALYTDDFETLVLCYETIGRILVHMGRSPDVNWFSTSKRKQKIVDEIEKIMSKQRFGILICKRLESVIIELKNDPEQLKLRNSLINKSEMAMYEIEEFNQTESFSGLLDYQRGIQRRKVAFGIEIMTDEWLNTYIHRAILLGKIEQIARLPLLPGAYSFYYNKDVKKARKMIDITLWNRFRWFVHYLLKKSKIGGNSD